MGELYLVGITVRWDLASEQIKPEHGHAYIAPIDLVPWLWQSPADAEGATTRSTATLAEDGTPLGPSHQLHDEVRNIGRGRFSHWNGVIYFSTSDNTDPRMNGRTYRLALVAYLRSETVVASILFLVVAFWTTRSELVALAARLSGSSWVAATHHRIALALRLSRMVLLQLALALVTTVLVLALLETLFRWSKPWQLNIWPVSFDARVGFRFTPNALVRFSNYIDFGTETQANSLGFLDREPVHDAGAVTTCRVLFMGDSFVEAAQVSIDKKSHVLFERLANHRLPQWTFQTMALGPVLAWPIRYPSTNTSDDRLHPPS